VYQYAGRPSISLLHTSSRSESHTLNLPIDLWASKPAQTITLGARSIAANRKRFVDAINTSHNTPRAGRLALSPICHEDAQQLTMRDGSAPSTCGRQPSPYVASPNKFNSMSSIVEATTDTIRLPAERHRDTVTSDKLRSAEHDTIWSRTSHRRVLLNLTSIWHTCHESPHILNLSFLPLIIARRAR
jgi:hypothetical protein